MRRMFGARDGWARISKRFRLLQNRPFCTNNRPNTPSNNSSNKVDGSLSTYDEAYRQLEKLDFMTAAKMLFTAPPDKKKFGIDFHLVQLFFACMPSLAVYLVAQYARHEMRRMEAELELKRQAEDEAKAKAKEMELNASKEKEAGSDPDLLEVKVRLDKLETDIKEIVVESKKQLGSISTENQNDGNENRHRTATEQSNDLSRSEAINSAAKDNTSKLSAAKDHTGEQASDDVAPSSSQEKASGSAAPATSACQHDHKGTQSKGPGKKL